MSQLHKIVKTSKGSVSTQLFAYCTNFSPLAISFVHYKAESKYQSTNYSMN